MYTWVPHWSCCGTAANTHRDRPREERLPAASDGGGPGWVFPDAPVDDEGRYWAGSSNRWLLVLRRSGGLGRQRPDGLTTKVVGPPTWWGPDGSPDRPA